jgi:hypothetical protein
MIRAAGALKPRHLRRFKEGLRMRRFLIVAVVAALALPAGAAPGELVSTLADQRAVSVTIYSGGIALVRDERGVRLPRGESRLALRDVSAQIMPETALLRSVTAPGAIDVLEQNFNFDLLSPQTLLEAYVGRQVTVIHTNPKTGMQTRESARVLATNGGVILQYADRIETALDGTLAFDAIPGALRDRPTLTVDLENGEAGLQTVEVAYLTDGLGWRADYVGALSADSTTLDLDGSVTLTNSSGTTYPKAHLLLVAGNVNVKRNSTPTTLNSTTLSGARVQQALGMPTVSEIGDFHLYTMPRATTIADRQTKQVALMQARAIPVKKTLELRGYPYYYRQAAPDLGERQPVQSYLTFINAGGDLGKPLPRGIVRIYQQDVNGKSEFIGSDTIDHTPKGETVRILLGESFDITARKRQTDYHPDGPGETRSTYEITLKNAKTTPASVLVVEPIPGDWTIAEESAPHVKTSSSTATWTLVVPAGGATKLTYTADVRS